ncbi:MAG: type 2 periplasmic-binding domain-containing protein [Rhodanobacter sp.]
MPPLSTRWLAVLGVLVVAGTCARYAMAAQAGESKIAVIVSSRDHDVPAIDSGMLRNIYLKKVFVDPQGHAYIPVNLPPDSKLRQAFFRTAIGMSELRLQNYWNQQYFQGVSPPFVLGSEAAVVEFVAKTPGAIGYVEPCFVTADVSTVQLLTLPAAASFQSAGACPVRATH